MADDIVNERMMRFHALYAGTVREKFDRAEFEADDLYAFQTFERALRSENQELRNLAAHLQAQRQADIESITLTPLEALARTRKLLILARDQEAESTALDSAVADPERPERCGGQPRLDPKDIAMVSSLQRLYGKEFGRALDIQKFIVDDEYGRTVLTDALGAADPDLVKAAKHFTDAQGFARLHRRGASSEAETAE